MEKPLARDILCFFILTLEFLALLRFSNKRGYHINRFILTSSNIHTCCVLYLHNSARNLAYN